MGGSYQQFADARDLPGLVAPLSVRTIVLDVEPLVAVWDGTQSGLDNGISQVLGRVAAIPGIWAVCFATNSARQPSALPAVPGIEVSYVASARKPAHIATYARLPLPGVVAGDQIMTDGLLARRLGYAFLHYRPRQSAPAGPKLLDLTGRLARPLIFPR